jgi:hypothetical protein
VSSPKSWRRWDLPAGPNARTAAKSSVTSPLAGFTLVSAQPTRREKVRATSAGLKLPCPYRPTCCWAS